MKKQETNRMVIKKQKTN